MRALRNFAFTTILIAALSCLAGCVPLLVGAAAGAGGITYARGALSLNVDATVEESHKAAVKALKNLKLFISSDELNKRDSVIKAEFANGRQAKISINAFTEISSKITVRVGFLGDRELSQLIMDAIERQL